MRRILIIVLILIFVAIFVLMAVSGLNIGSIRIPAVRDIVQEKEKLDFNVENLNSMIEKDFPAAKTALNTSYQSLQTSKEKYEDFIRYKTKEEIKQASQDEKYEIGYLWTKIGLYATNRNIEMKAEVVSANPIDSEISTTNISFTVAGAYLSISEFIHDIENDSALGFKIEDFTLLPSSEGVLQGTFIIKNVPINRKSLISGTSGATY